MHCWSIMTELLGKYFSLFKKVLIRLELTFKDFIPIFAECWWDQLICDVLLTNIPGMIVAMYIIRKTGLEEFDFFGRKGAKSIREWKIWQRYLLIFSYCV